MKYIFSFLVLIFSNVIQSYPKIEILKDNSNYLNIKEGNIIEGSFSKPTIGNTSHSIIRHIYYEYGPHTANTFLNNIKSLISMFLIENGFTVGLGDVIIPSDIESNIKHMINNTYTDEYKALSPEFTNPPDAEYQTTVMAFNFSIHSS